MIYVRTSVIAVLFKTRLTSSCLDLWGRYLCSASRYSILLLWRSLGYWWITVWKTHWSSSVQSMFLQKRKTISPSITGVIQNRGEKRPGSCKKVVCSDWRLPSRCWRQHNKWNYVSKSRRAMKVFLIGDGLGFPWQTTNIDAWAEGFSHAVSEEGERDCGTAAGTSRNLQAAGPAEQTRLSGAPELWHRGAVGQMCYFCNICRVSGKHRATHPLELMSSPPSFSLEGALPWNQFTY